MALSLLEILTNYAQECHIRLSRNRHDAGDGDYGSYSDLSELPPYPDENAGWAALPSKIAAQIKDFRGEVREAVEHIEFDDEVIGPPQSIDTATHFFIKIGYRAAALAEKLRNHYGFGPSALNYYRKFRKDYRAIYPGPLQNFWRSLPVKKMRRGFYRLRRNAGAIFKRK